MLAKRMVRISSGRIFARYSDRALDRSKHRDLPQSRLKRGEAGRNAKRILEFSNVWTK